MDKPVYRAKLHGGPFNGEYIRCPVDGKTLTFRAKGQKGYYASSGVNAMRWVEVI